MTKSFWDDMAVSGESVEDRMSIQGEKVKDRMAIKHENPDQWASEMAVKGNSVKSITDQSGDMECSYYNEPQHESFNWKPDYSKKRGKESLEKWDGKGAGDNEGEHMRLGENENNRP